ncbi:hypothetical protein VXC91_25655 [Streptomyces chiangmaiensis]|uniref:Uncharacterized protein n=1 Tax=Streptomyces chiangmaiensis TaxID=766497 RepID=A0ABU7FMD7_9ACTN|nr:hypothetical protein [Streptomyces chiangmaiensis]
MYSQAVVLHVNSVGNAIACLKHLYAADARRFPTLRLAALCGLLVISRGARAGDVGFCGEVETAIHIEVDLAVRADVGPRSCTTLDSPTRVTPHKITAVCGW